MIEAEDVYNRGRRRYWMKQANVVNGRLRSAPASWERGGNGRRAGLGVGRGTVVGE